METVECFIGCYHIILGPFYRILIYWMVSKWMKKNMISFLGNYKLGTSVRLLLDHAKQIKAKNNTTTTKTHLRYVDKSVLHKLYSSCVFFMAMHIKWQIDHQLHDNSSSNKKKRHALSTIATRMRFTLNNAKRVMYPLRVYKSHWNVHI